jgi:4-hydroxy-2-oxoheptanedioate aldolase
MPLKQAAPLLARLKKGEVAFNGWLSVPDPFTAETMAAAGWDCLTFDMQHGEIGYGDLRHMLPAINLAGGVAIARLADKQWDQITRILDVGAAGVICPLIDNAEEAASLVAACRYPPLGNRSHGPLRAGLRDGPGYTGMTAEGQLIFAMIETRSGLDNLDSILKVDGLTGIYVGASDLSLSLGGAAGLDRPDAEFTSILRDIAKRTRSAGLVAGLHTGSVAYGRQAVEWGFNFVTTTSEIKLIALGAKAQLEALADLRDTVSVGANLAY